MYTGMVNCEKPMDNSRKRDLRFEFTAQPNAQRDTARLAKAMVPYIADLAESDKTHVRKND